MHSRGRMYDHRPPDLLQCRQTSRALSAKRRVVFGASRMKGELHSTKRRQRIDPTCVLIGFSLWKRASMYVLARGNGPSIK